MEVVQVVDTTLIGISKYEALERIRDPTDWPALALALQPARAGAVICLAAMIAPRQAS
jgi:hypothetical protein